MAEKHTQTQEQEPSPVLAVAEEQYQEQPHHVTIPVVAEEQSQEQEPPPICDIDRLEHDLGLRVPIASYNVNDQNAVRRGFILKGPCQPYAHDYPTRNIYGKDRRFSII